MDLRRAFPDFKVTIDRVIEQGDIVVARWTTTMTHKDEFLGFPATRKKVTVTGTSMQRIANGKIVEGWGTSWDYWCRLARCRRRIL